jgi:DNA-3-methyladenine glycosylase II
MNGTGNLRIETPPIFSFKECVWFLDRNYDDCLHEVYAERVRKALRVDGELILFDIKESAGFLEVAILKGECSYSIRTQLERYIRNWFDMDRDIEPFYALLRNDPRVGYMVDAFDGLRLIGISDLFEALCWSIIGQQINLSFAYKLKRRLVERYGECIILDKSIFHVFPSCEVLANANVEDLRAMQFSQKKAEYVIDLARAFSEGRLSKELLTQMPSFEAKQKALMAHRGIGLWTANYALMKSLREPGGIPYGDVGLLNALTAHGVITSRDERNKMDAFLDTFGNWESYMVFYLWRSLAVRVPLIN